MKKAKILLSFIFGLVALTGFAQEDYFTNVSDTKSHTVMELAQNDDRFSIFVSFLEASGLDTSMEYAEGYTVFMPTNEAFGEMKLEKLSNLAGSGNQMKVMDFVKNYILSTKVTTSDFEDDQIIDLEGDNKINISTDMNSQINIGGAQIIQGDIEAEDGVIHVIDELITPTPEFMY